MPGQVLKDKQELDRKREEKRPIWQGEQHEQRIQMSKRMASAENQQALFPWTLPLLVAHSLGRRGSEQCLPSSRMLLACFTLALWVPSKQRTSDPSAWGHHVKAEKIATASRVPSLPGSLLLWAGASCLLSQALPSPRQLLTPRPLAAGPLPYKSARQPIPLSPDKSTLWRLARNPATSFLSTSGRKGKVNLQTSFQH